MTGIHTGNIAYFVEQVKTVLEQHVKSSEFIAFKNNLDEKQLTISISAVIADSIDIYNVITDNVLNVYILHNMKKAKKNLDSKDEEQNKELVINYKDVVDYKIILAVKGVANVSKTLKKNKLQMIKCLDEKRTLYKFMNKYFLVIDSNGILYYYPDSITIESLIPWIETSINKTKHAQFLDNNMTLEKYLFINNFILLDCNLDTVSYELCDIMKDCSFFANNVNASINSNNVFNLVGNNNTQDSINSNTSPYASYSTLGYILSWLNPLAYYTSNTSNTSDTGNISSSISINQEDKTINNTDKDNQIKDKENKNTENKNTENKNNINKIIPVENTNTNNTNASYYLDKSSLNYDLIKVQDNQVKILKAQKIDLPIFMNDIVIDNVDNIVFSGKINEYPITLKFNKYMLGMHLV